MSNQRIKIPRVSDRTIAETFKTLGDRYGISNANVSALAFSSIGQVSLSQEANGDWKALLDHDSSLIESMSLSIGGLGITYARGGQYPAEQKSPIFDEIVLTWNNHQASPTNAEKLDIVAFINSTLCPFEPGRAVGSGVSEEQSQLLAIHESTLERLEKLNEDLIRQSSEFRRGLEEKFEEKIRQADAEYAEKKRQLETEGQAFAEQIDAKERALEEKLKVVDDRDNTYVRREIRDRMLDDVKQRINKFGVSESTERKRRPVLYGIISLIAIFALLLLWTALEISTVDRKSTFNISAAVYNIASGAQDLSKAAVDKTSLYLLWIRFSLFTLGLMGTLLYYVKWQNKWAEQHASSEFQLQQFYIDVNRANWVIESCLEWRKETQSVIPKELLGSITNGLFVNKQADIEKVIHPADELASALMGSASKLKLNLGGNEVEIDKPRKIAKEITSNSP